VQRSQQGCGSAGASPSRHRLLPQSQCHWAAARGQTALPTRCQNPHQRAHLRCESQPGASARPLKRAPSARNTTTDCRPSAGCRDAVDSRLALRICAPFLLPFFSTFSAGLAEFRAKFQDVGALFDQATNCQQGGFVVEAGGECAAFGAGLRRLVQHDYGQGQ
jgi:hypothetical protein